MRCDKALKFLPKGDNNFMKHEKNHTICQAIAVINKSSN